LLEVEGVIPSALQGDYFVTGPGILKQDGKNVYPFDGHGLVRRFSIDGSQVLELELRLSNYCLLK